VFNIPPSAEHDRHIVNMLKVSSAWSIAAMCVRMRNGSARQRPGRVVPVWKRLKKKSSCKPDDVPTTCAADKTSLSC